MVGLVPLPIPELWFCGVGVDVPDDGDEDGEDEGRRDWNP